MRFILSLISIIIGAAFAQIYSPWWVATIICFLIGGIAGMKGLSSFFTGFLGIALLWGGYAFYLDTKSGSLLSGKMALLFGESFSSPALLIATAVLGGLIGGFACLSGSLGRAMFKDK